jgi:hypothetical protein
MPEPNTGRSPTSTAFFLVQRFQVIPDEAIIAGNSAETHANASEIAWTKTRRELRFARKT